MIGLSRICRTSSKTKAPPSAFEYEKSPRATTAATASASRTRSRPAGIDFGGAEVGGGDASGMGGSGKEKTPPLPGASRSARVRALEDAGDAPGNGGVF